MAAEASMFDPSVFANLQAKLDEETKIREDLRNLVQELEKQDRITQGVLSRVHSTPHSQLADFLQSQVHPQITKEKAILGLLQLAADHYPYYKYNHLSSRAVQDTVSTTLLYFWLTSYAQTGTGRLIEFSALARELKVPVESPGFEDWRISMEEYLHGTIGVADELVRFARNAVTMGDYSAPVAVARFVKDLHAGFQVLNLKNDALRKRGDGVKYRVKEIEDVVYDLTLRGLIKAGGA